MRYCRPRPHNYMFILAALAILGVVGWCVLSIFGSVVIPIYERSNASTAQGNASNIGSNNTNSTAPDAAGVTATAASVSGVSATSNASDIHTPDTNASGTNASGTNASGANSSTVTGGDDSTQPPATNMTVQNATALNASAVHGDTHPTDGTTGTLATKTENLPVATNNASSQAGNNASDHVPALLRSSSQSGHISATSSTNTGTTGNTTGLESIPLPSIAVPNDLYSPIPEVEQREVSISTPTLPLPSVASLHKRYAAKTPRQWGETIPGVVTHLSQGQNASTPPSVPVIALTLDACGGRKGQSCDEGLLDFLEENSIPATIFITESWMRNNAVCLERLNDNPLYELANHGKRHRPASVNGQSAYGVNGTRNVYELYDEVESTATAIEKITGRRPLWYRSGTAFYDEVAIDIIHELHQNIAGYSITIDQGATLSAKRVAANVRRAKDGDILLGHLNHPKKGTRQGLMEGLPELLEQGYRFVRLSDVRYSIGN